jgi:hypothetical protein
MFQQRRMDMRLPTPRAPASTALAAISVDASAGRADRILLTLLAVASLLGCDPRAAARVDSCLDRGGSYDYQLGECDLERSHPGPGADEHETPRPRH